VSLVVFPFKEEETSVVARNLETAARHPRVREVWAVAASEGAMMSEVAAAGAEVAGSEGTPVRVFPQERIGSLRSGKGDGMNTAIGLAAEHGFQRTHFYDADITNFDASWIEGAEEAADRGYGVVRHRFPRAATDAMITWMVTRPGLALRFPGTVLPRLGQPLGGEILLTRTAVEQLATNSSVRARSDWGIDTAITHATTLMDLGIYEHYATDGKRHALYGSLTDIREMVLECLDAVARVEGAPDGDIVFDADPPAEVPADLKTTVGYDLGATRRSISAPMTTGEREIIESLDLEVSNLDIDGDHWLSILPGILTKFDLGNEDWRSVFFRLWAERVIHYTTHQVPLGYDAALDYLESTILDFERAGSHG
jgi:mannosylglycerate synthase